MLTVITGDIVNSRRIATSRWQPRLENILKQYGRKTTDWEIFRGDSFQIRLTTERAMHAAIHIKAGIKQLPGLDVRMGIGAGDQDFKARKITASTGSAFIRSGAAFDNLKKQTIIISTGNEKTDEAINLMLSLALLTMNNWSTTVALAITRHIENKDKSQLEIAAIMKKSQSSVSEALKRGGFEEVKQMELYCRKELSSLLK